ncbi:hypothetical protein J6590_037606 [Homalodisca vitripennis]|nr:hypothetical protein J6590_037606 [Homalodisca vitripennis]
MRSSLIGLNGRKTGVFAARRTQTALPLHSASREILEIEVVTVPTESESEGRHYLRGCHITESRFTGGSLDEAESERNPFLTRGEHWGKTRSGKVTEQWHAAPHKGDKATEQGLGSHRTDAQLRRSCNDPFKDERVVDHFHWNINSSRSLPFARAVEGVASADRCGGGFLPS